MTAKRKKCQSCGGPTSGVRCQPCKEAAWQARQADPARTCSQCGTRKPKSPQHPRCLVCMKGGPEAYNAWNKARKHAKGYQRPRALVEQQREAMRRRRAEAKARRVAQMANAWTRHPDVLALIADGYTVANAVARVRYRSDVAFRAREKAKTHARRRQKYAGDGTLTSHVIAAMYQWDQTCAYCGDAMSPESRTLDHITPLSRGGQHAADNVVVVHATCNYRKRNKTLPEYVAWRIRYGHHVPPGLVTLTTGVASGTPDPGFCLDSRTPDC